MPSENGTSPQFWLFVEIFYNSHKLYREQYDLYESRLHDGRFSPPNRHPVSTDRWGEGDPVAISGNSRSAACVSESSRSRARLQA